MTELACPYLGKSSMCRMQIASGAYKLLQDQCLEAAHAMQVRTISNEYSLGICGKLCTCSMLGTTKSSPNAKSTGSEVALCMMSTNIRPLLPLANKQYSCNLLISIVSNSKYCSTLSPEPCSAKRCKSTRSNRAVRERKEFVPKAPLSTLDLSVLHSRKPTGECVHNKSLQCPGLRVRLCVCSHEACACATGCKAAVHHTCAVCTVSKQQRRCETY